MTVLARPLPRRAVLNSLLALPVLSACANPKTTPSKATTPVSVPPAREAAADFAKAVQQLEQRYKTEVGAFALDTGSGKALEHRADQRFMLCSVFKGLAVGAVLRKAQDDPGILARTVAVPAEPGAVLDESPITSRLLGQAVSYGDLCKAAVQVSDNFAANLILDLLGGPGGITAFIRSLGDDATRVDRYEPDMNFGKAEDLLDTTTPRAIATSYQKLLLGDALVPAGRQQLAEWMLGTTSGTGRIRAGLPKDWKVADKTGTGPKTQGDANDVAVIWPDGGRAPLVLAILTRTPPPTERKEQLLADVTNAAKSAFAL